MLKKDISACLGLRFSKGCFFLEMHVCLLQVMDSLSICAARHLRIIIDSVRTRCFLTCWGTKRQNLPDSGGKLSFFLYSPTPTTPTPFKPPPPNSHLAISSLCGPFFIPMGPPTSINTSIIGLTIGSNELTLMEETTDRPTRSTMNVC